ncbi:glycosyl hydrolase [Penicillium canescens]|uniref:Glycosyl hydrolase n=1 Tax=Penicillium canescens TaxID=5083 RepID=A0AAD6N3M5_PENCN|nr:glycosyl hydrolase [Penicillium canescens]KAJ6027073.1 glycosyl hydrolase [Penicillium canescens]KAJ6040357.1 glycosyl hydrolase [Penicillium canescens]KAJ6067290.1 glycosyl hydrolase [Penicillium canescens]KAJ6085550.1 glycosyl hydrolase [Penicillium canescens]KAJ6162324.1 glycosyl hydrolase [Penicillium canescens]
MPTPRAINPIIPGFAPDPSIVGVAGWYFLVNSTFHLFPGLPIYASKDLVSWRQIGGRLNYSPLLRTNEPRLGHAINRRDQLSLSKSATRLSAPSPSTGGKILPATAGLYAPTIRYHAGKFYVVCTNALYNKNTGQVGKQNFLVSTTDIWSDIWSDPVYFDFVGIDPDLFFDDGKIYITGSATPGPWTRINCFEIDIETGKRLLDERTIWTGTGGVYPEGPHIYKRNGWYYLLIAEGGTHLTHMITMARSRSIWGPYESCPNNPILTANGTDEYIQHTGHGDLFEDNDGQWWAVCLAVRKDKRGRYAMSRETFLTSAKWHGEWPSLEPVKLVPRALSNRNETPSLSAGPLIDYVYIRDVSLGKYSFNESNSNITLTASSTDLSDPEASPTFVGKRQRLLEGQSSVTVAGISDTWSSARLKCGLAYYKDEHRYIRIFFDASDSSVAFEEKNSAQEIVRTSCQALEKTPDSISLRMEYTEQEFHLMYALESGPHKVWIRLALVDTMDMTDPDFVGPVIGVFAVSETEGVKVNFEQFSCS